MLHPCVACGVWEITTTTNGCCGGSREEGACTTYRCCCHRCGLPNSQWNESASMQNCWTLVGGDGVHVRKQPFNTQKEFSSSFCCFQHTDLYEEYVWRLYWADWWHSQKYICIWIAEIWKIYSTVVLFYGSRSKKRTYQEMKCRKKSWTWFPHFKAFFSSNRHCHWSTLVQESYYWHNNIKYCC